MRDTARWSANELVPLAERLRYMLLVRIVLVGTIGLTAAFAPPLFGPVPKHLAAVLGGWALLAAAAEAVWRVAGRRSLPLFGITLIADGLALVWLSSVGSVTNVRYLIFLHMAAVVLLASYRTGLKMALWYALLLFTVFFAARNGAFGIGPLEPGTAAAWDLGQVSTFVASLWLVALATAGFSSVNERELRRRRFDLEALARLATAFESAADRRTVAGILLDSLAENFPVGRLLLTSAGRSPVVLGQRGLPLAAKPASLDVSSALVRAATERETLLLAAFDRDSDPWLTGVFADGGNFLVVPLFAEGGCVGILVVEHTARNGSRVERRLVSIIERFASHTALAVRNASLLEEMERMANTDGLTLVANRRTFDRTLQREVARSIRSGDPFSLVMIDIDDFKMLNDTHGHPVGDEVLRQVASALQASSRDLDLTARYGGEEFAVILPGCGAADALVSADRLHRCLDGATTVPVTASVGVATFPDCGSTAQGLVKAADDALYEAKRSGRNQVQVSRPKDQVLTTLRRSS